MSYDMVMEKIKTLPETALEEVSLYLDKIGSIYQARKNIDFSFVDNIFGTLNDSEADELRSCCGLKFRKRPACELAAQGIVGAAKPYFAKQSMKPKGGTADSP